MINRRELMATAIAATILSAGTARGHAKGEEYVLPEEYMPREVRLREKMEAGQVIVDPNSFSLYWTLGRRKALRFTAGIGRGNLYHDGEFYVGRKQEWPDWRPTPDMMERSPNAYQNFAEGEIFENGQPGGISNPLGARAMYLYNVTTQRDTYLRLHGTNDPRTIGIAVSNGCARLINPQIEQLYELVPLGTRVALLPKADGIPAHSSV